VDNERHDLFTMFLDEVKATWRRHGLSGVLPWVFGLCAGAGYGVASRASHLLFIDTHWGTLAAVYAGVLTFNGIALALTWTAIGKVYDTITRGEFAAFLRAAGSIQQYQFYIQFMHLIQIFAAVASVLGLFVTFAELPELVGRIAFGTVAAATLYSIKWAAGSVRIVRDLTDRQVEFDGLPADEKRRLMLVAANATTR
jgi:hypothetical protein